MSSQPEKVIPPLHVRLGALYVEVLEYRRHTEVRFAHIEERLDKLDRRLNSLECKLDRILAALQPPSA